ncbi:hypothetical protein [Nitrosococcus oceani]|uniref:Glycosyltransferase RgtA/B/C/D-like domain-containing protein n=2 Tax=Nitrosococcus oceani TaxID=1229 RepID=Q3JD29_NITOC|nr:hypothetical protein [Nitrosococcus oceani]KFI20242.1 hypothetical protein IB75_03795 [Nitrosococcus oceani C-27]ABA57267.1 hypothetical protein Noc_0754 [Nitrosococcus oceani ATCC 19707]EDZ66478.1 hypothetical protein NOC27_3158 [Nitrosococcus oceani AFC27]KFI23344.1 hypothetical protein HW44_03685 [Nitrosococcus oceani]GEM20140.1 hypothetical protein NONS58_15470 [Nitrosococcus oceani]
MILFQLLTALFLPWLLGVAWLRIGWPRTARGAGPLVLGYAYLLGTLATTFMMRLWDGIGLKQAFWPLAGLLLALTLLGFWVSRTKTRKDDGYVDNSAVHSWNSWQTGLFALLIALLAIRFVNLGLEILWRPLYPWDAWTTWAPRAQVWFALKELVPFVDSATWLHHPSRDIYTLPAWSYPETVSLIQLWISLALEQWDDSLINLPWLFCAAALGLAFYGQLRLWGLVPLASLLGTYLLLSLPLLNIHTALAGYADLWLAATYSLAGMAFLQWLRNGDPWQGGLALLLALACPFIKREGLIWMLTFLPPLLIACLPCRTRLLAGAGGVALLAIWYVSGGIRIGEFQLTPEVIQIPSLGHFEISLQGGWEPFQQNLLVLDNWHLLWYLAIPAMALSIPLMIARRQRLIGLTFIGSGLVVIFGTFFLTDNAAWAESYTSINRILLHWVPLLLFYVLVLLQACMLEPRRD